MKKYEVLVEDESAELLTGLLQSLPYVKEVKQTNTSMPIHLLPGKLWQKIGWLKKTMNCKECITSEV